MSQSIKNKIAFVISLLLAVGVYVWFFPLNKGTLELKTGAAGYRVFIDGEELSCSTDPCHTKLKSGVHEFLLHKEKHITVSQNIIIKRGAVNQIAVDLKRAYALEPTNVMPRLDSKPKRSIPQELAGSVSASTWNQNATRLVYLDKTNERLKIWNDGNNTEFITVLKNIEPPLNLYWSSNEINLVAHQKQDLYWIDTKKATRHKKILTFTPIALSWSPSGELLLLSDEQEKLYRWSAGKNPEALERQLNLTNSAWIDDKTLLFFLSDTEKNRTDVKTYDPAADRLTTLTTKFDFLTTGMTFDAVNTTAYFRKDTGEWYELKW